MLLGVGRLLWFMYMLVSIASALFYVYACEYCFCFVLCICLYVSLYVLCIASALFYVYACRVGYVSWAGLLLGGGLL